MIDQKQSLDQLPNEIKPAFLELNVLKHLNGAAFKKKFGFTCAYLFRLVFVLLFHQKNWFRLLESQKGESFPAKDVVYRFLNPQWLRVAAIFTVAEWRNDHANGIIDFGEPCDCAHLRRFHV
jgi:hypothetical protein